ncbi:hypothetical protein T06_3719 [Trichinella sp. T6]|nr:hypothetical protein T06_3719 [Trichinella sp. T6]
MHACLLNSVEFSSSHITTSHLQVTESVTHILMVQCFELLSITFREFKLINVLRNGKLDSLKIVACTFERQ